jgi:hypothetical protein
MSTASRPILSFGSLQLSTVANANIDGQLFAPEHLTIQYIVRKRALVEDGIEWSVFQNGLSRRPGLPQAN